MNTKEQVQYEAAKHLFLAAKAEAAVLFDMPEIAVPRDFGKDIDVDERRFKIEVDIRPTGQMRALVKTLRAQVEMGLKPCERGNYYMTVSLLYSHQDGGRNGKDTRFVVMTEDRCGNWLSFARLVSLDVYYAVQQQCAGE